MTTRTRPQPTLALVSALLIAGCTAAPGFTPSSQSSPTPSAVPSTPTAAPTAPSSAPSHAGVRLTSAFEPSFVLNYSPSEWTVFDDNQPRDVFIQYQPTQEALQFIAIDNVAKTPCAPSSEPAAVFPTVPWNGARAGDFGDWLRSAAGPALTLSAAEPVTLGGASGVQIDIIGKGAPNCAFIRVTMWASDNSLRISTMEPPARVIALNVGGQTVTIWFHGSGETFESIAERLLSSLQFG